MIRESAQTFFFTGRKLCWFSHGAASACTAKLAIEKYGHSDLEVVYCDTSKDEHEDNERFRRDVEQWIQHPIRFIKSQLYSSCDEVYDKTGYIAGINGARCTTELKKIPRQAFEYPEDLHLFGYTVNEKKRIREFEEDNFELRLEWILRDQGITKTQCFKMLQDVGIRLPEMYLLGYKNNNCKGCVKSSSPGYWQKVRRDFPDFFELRAKRSRELNVRLLVIDGERMFLDELPPDDVRAFKYKGEDLSCGPQCAPPKEGSVLVP